MHAALMRAGTGTMLGCAAANGRGSRQESNGTRTAIFFSQKNAKRKEWGYRRKKKGGSEG
jgi:hypothetical protein